MKSLAVLILAMIPLLYSCKGGESGSYKSVNKTEENKGKVIAIIDGDTYDILLSENKKLRIRMEGIDAPEKGMPYYKIAKNYLGKICFKKNIRLEITGKDIRGRILAYSYLNDGRELSHEMIKAGMAWHFKNYSSDSVLSSSEKSARNAKLGLWADNNPMPPWENRRLHRNGVSTKDSFNIKESFIHTTTGKMWLSQKLIPEYMPVRR